MTTSARKTLQAIEAILPFDRSNTRTVGHRSIGVTLGGVHFLA
jgi:hypothetical protein